MNITTPLSILAAATCAMIAHAEPFTYQGQLTDDGVPANGSYDITLRITDAAVGGSVIGSGFSFNDVIVTDGVFELEFDPGDIFTAQDVWLQVTIDDNGSPVTLTPNTKINATPKAQHATVAETALNAPWTVAPGIISFGDGNDHVFINRTTGITPAEVFGIHGTSGSFNGMYVSGPANSFPFYGYSTDGNIDAYHYFNAATQEWILTTGGTTSITVDAQNDMTVANNINADEFRYNSPKTQVISISGSSFYSASNRQFFASLVIGGSYLAEIGTGTMVAPLQLPHGAVLQSLTAYVGDEVPGDLSVSLRYQTHGGTGTDFVFFKSTAGMSGPDLMLSDPTPLPGPQIVDNYAGHYHLAFFSSSWPGTNQMRISSVVIEYTIDEAN